jgi:hypothetical protein
MTAQTATIAQTATTLAGALNVGDIITVLDPSFGEDYNAEVKFIVREGSRAIVTIEDVEWGGPWVTLGLHAGSIVRLAA